MEKGLPCKRMMHGRSFSGLIFRLGYSMVLVQVIRNLVQQPLRIIPSQAGIGDGLAVAVFPDFLAAGFNVALNHKALYQMFDIAGVAAAVEHFLGYTNLFMVLLVGVGVVGVHDDGGILLPALVIKDK